MKTKTKPFSELTKAQQRVAVAEDAIQQIKAGRFKMEKGTYLRRLDDGMQHFNQELLLTGAECGVCGIGAALCSLVRLDNKLDVKGRPSSHQMKVRLLDVFSTKDISNIEHAFERWNFTSRFRQNKESNRAIAIFKNIIRNKGEFIP